MTPRQARRCQESIVHNSTSTSQFGGGVKQCKKRAYSEIQNVENSRNFCKVVPVPPKLVLVQRLENKVVTKWYQYYTYWYRYQSPKKTGSTLLVLVPHLLVPVPPYVNGYLKSLFLPFFLILPYSPPNSYIRETPT